MGLTALESQLLVIVRVVGVDRGEGFNGGAWEAVGVVILLAGLAYVNFALLFPPELDHDRVCGKYRPFSRALGKDAGAHRFRDRSFYGVVNVAHLRAMPRHGFVLTGPGFQKFGDCHAPHLTVFHC